MPQPSPWTGRQRLLRGEVDKLFVFLPYLKTSDEVVLRGVRFLPLRQAKRSRSRDAAVVRDLASLFWFRDDIRIVDMSYSIIEIRPDSQSGEDLDANLDAISYLLGYLYTSPGRQPREPFLRFEHATVFRFVQSVLPRWRMGGVDNPALSHDTFARRGEDANFHGYEGWTHRKESLLLSSSSRIYPPVRDFWLNASQDLYANVRGIGWPRLERRMPILFSSRTALQSALEERILRALRWYCKSSEIISEPDEALLRLAIAFETLLVLDRDAKAEDLHSRISLLIGPVPRLDSWAQQFYRARSFIVHEGETPHTRFLAVDAKEADKAWYGKIPAAYYRRLVDYARVLFRPCVHAALWGGASSFDLRLNRLFFHNQQRLEAICKCLSRENLDQAEVLMEIAELVGSLADARWDSDHVTKMETVAATGRLLLEACLDGIPVKLIRAIDPQIQDLLSYNKSQPMQELVTMWQNLAKQLDALLQQNATSAVIRPSISDPKSWTYILRSYASFAGTMGVKAWAHDEFVERVQKSEAPDNKDR